MDNPLKYSDLIQDDGAIENLINQLNEAINAFDTAKGKLQAIASELVKSLQNISGASEEQRQTIVKTVKDTEKLIEAYKNEDSAQRAAYREKQKLTQIQKEAQQIDKLTIQLNKAKKGSYNALSAEYRLLKIQIDAMGESEAEYAKKRAMEKKARAIYEQMSNLQKATGKYTLEVGHYQNAMLGLTGPMNQVITAFTSLGSSMKQVFQTEMPAGQKAIAAMEVGIVGLIAVVVALAKALKSTITLNAEFEQTNVDLATVLGKNKKDIKALTDTALSLGRTTEWTASQVTQLQIELAKLGFGEGSIIAMQKHVLAFATAVGANLADAAQMAGTVIRAFNLTSADTEDALGTLAIAVNSSALTFDRLKQAMGTVFPVAKAFGLSLKDTTSLLGALANAGFSAETAATAARNVLIKLADENGKLAQKTGSAAKSFEDIMQKLKDLRAEGVNLSDIFGLTEQRAAAPFAALIEGYEKAEELRKKLEDVNGELQRIQQTKLDSVIGQSKILTSKWQDFLLVLQQSNGAIKQLEVIGGNIIDNLKKGLFPAESARMEAIDSYLDIFRDSAKNVDGNVEVWKKRTEHYLSELKKSIKETEESSWFFGKKETVRDMKARYEGAYEAAMIVYKELLNSQEELAAQQAKEVEDENQRVAEATDEANKQRLKNLQAIVEQKKMELSIEKKGTQEWLNKRLELIEAERDLEIEKNLQAEESAQKDIKVINDKYNNDRIQATKDFWNEVSKLRQQALQADKDAIESQISLTQEGSDEMLQLRLASLEKQRDIEIEANRQKDERIQQDEEKIRYKYWQKAFQLEADFLTKRAQQNLKAYQELEASEFALLDKNERQKTEFRLEQEKERLIKILEINSTATEQMSEMEIKAIENTIEAIDKEIGRLPYNNIYELLGINITTQQQEALKTALDSIRDSIGSIIDSWKDAADAAVEAADKQVDAAQKVLDAEIEARNNGYANEVETARKRLEEEEKNRRKALKDQEKAKRAQLGIDAAMQASSLITATANIWKALSSTVVGIALATVATGAMWTSFIAAQAKAMSLTKKEYGEGTVELLEGGSHASGNDIDLGYDRRTRRHRRAEGGEFFAVVNKRNSRKYRNVIPDVINSFNDGSFANKYQKTSEVMNGMVINTGSGTDVSYLEKNVKAIKEQGERQIITIGDRIIYKYKNLTQTIRK